jgi:hypothetical protein
METLLATGLQINCAGASDEYFILKKYPPLGGGSRMGSNPYRKFQKYQNHHTFGEYYTLLYPSSVHTPSALFTQISSAYMEMECVYCAAWTEYLNINQINFRP